ncbi:MAG: 2-C-methyl-D-erythritol 4-phosphate cytidylyltransferase [Erysipelotrichaceae bacterium]|jgi:2-C-methyl-D-erythritol 4-phosphate cytidylyltransferase|nr:2-C-methyl-D-erythritol 4-phosphate cytidylyltransferase [Erysipelotrichaceae bacterium]
MENKIPHIALVLFGGSGLRFGSDIPKQFVTLIDKPLIEETLSALEGCPSVEEVHLVTRAEDQEKTKEIASRYPKVKGIYEGGKTRQDSARLGLLALRGKIPEDALVAIMDGDRPCIEEELLRQNYEKAAENGACVTVSSCSNSVLLSKDGEKVSSYLNRDEVYLVATPQTFSYGTILKSHLEAKEGHTDDASLFQGPVALLKWDKQNVKITTKEDVEAFKQWKTRRR